MTDRALLATGVAVLAFSLICGLAHGGDLNPPGAPAPTMKTLDQIPPTWSQKLQCDSTACPRFQLVLDDAAVLDKETGLVWEKSPDATPRAWWGDALTFCFQKSVAGRKGWRLPTVEELASLPALPVGHPFLNVQTSLYFSATTAATNTFNAWLVSFPGGSVVVGDKTLTYYAWCVRGGRGHDGW